MCRNSRASVFLCHWCAAPCINARLEHQPLLPRCVCSRHLSGTLLDSSYALFSFRQNAFFCRWGNICCSWQLAVGGSPPPSSRAPFGPGWPHLPGAGSGLGQGVKKWHQTLELQLIKNGPRLAVCAPVVPVRPFGIADAATHQLEALGPGPRVPKAHHGSNPPPESGA